MTQLSELSSLTDVMLGAEAMYNDDVKTEGLNAGSNEILLNYDVKEFRKTVDLTFTTGISPVPADYLRFSRLFDSTSPRTKYTKVDDDKFDFEISNTWCKKADMDDSDIQKFFIFPTLITTRRLRYVKVRTKMSADINESGFVTYWDNALAAYAAYFVLLWDRQYDASTAMLQQAQGYIETALRQQGSEEEGTTEVTTRYDDETLLGRESD